MNKIISYTEFVNETKNVHGEYLNPEHEFGVFSFGGSIGGHSVNSEVGKHTSKGYSVLIKTFSTSDDAKIFAKYRRSLLSPGEKKYYGMGYSIIKLTKGDKKAIIALLKK